MISGEFKGEIVESFCDIDGKLVRYGYFVSLVLSIIFRPLFFFILIKLSTSTSDYHFTEVADSSFTCMYEDTGGISDKIHSVNFLIVRSANLISGNIIFPIILIVVHSNRFWLSQFLKLSTMASHPRTRILHILLSLFY